MKKRGNKDADKPLLDEEQQIAKLGARIKALRESKGYTSYEKFAFEHDIPRAQLGRYERGQDLRFSSLIKILNALDVNYIEFFQDGFE